jgi:ankyrin repeat protein
MISLLLEKGADINMKDEVRALLSLILSVSVSLLSSVVCSSQSGNTALHSASSIYRISLALYLLEQGVDVNLQNVNGDTALHLVCREPPHYSIANQLVENGTNVNLTNIVSRPRLPFSPSH